MCHTEGQNRVAMCRYDGEHRGKICRKRAGTGQKCVARGTVRGRNVSQRHRVDMCHLRCRSTLKQLGHFFSSKYNFSFRRFLLQMIYFRMELVQHKDDYSVFWIRMAFCLSTIASVIIVLNTHPRAFPATYGLHSIIILQHNLAINVLYHLIKHVILYWIFNILNYSTNP